MLKTRNETRIDNGKNYWCSWATQCALGKNKLAAQGLSCGYFEGADTSMYARFEINEERIFGDDGFAQQFPELRSDLLKTVSL